MAIALTNALGGAEGIAQITKELLLNPATQPATKTRILADLSRFMANASKQYGDRPKFSDMSKQQIEVRLCKLLQAHGWVVPIPGVNVNVSEAQKPGEAEGQSASPSAEAQTPEHRAAEAANPVR